jgi:hypothetical protein
VAWTYDPTKFEDPTVGTYAGSTVGVRNQIRFLIQDTISTRPLMQDEEIDWTQTQEQNAYTAAAMCCENLVAKAGAIKSKRISEFYITYDTGFYTDLAVIYRGRGASHQIPYCGGISVSDKQAVQGDPDWVRPKFYRGLDDNPAAPGPANAQPNPPDPTL